MRSRLGAPKAITATAHKLARLVYSLLKHGSAYVQQGLDAYEIFHVEADQVSTVSRADYGLAGKVTRVIPGGGTVFDFTNQNLALMRRTKVFVADALLPLGVRLDGERRSKVRKRALVIALEFLLETARRQRA